MAFTLVSVVFLISLIVSLSFFCLSSQAAVCLEPGCLKTSASILSAMNQSADPCQNFYDYACGCWLDSVDIPPGHSKWNTFQIVEQSNKKALKKLLEKGSVRHSGVNSSAFRKAKDYYTACMDYDGRQEKGVKPILDLIKEVGGWPVLGDDPSTGGWDNSGWNITGMMIKLHRLGISPLFFLYIANDDRDSTQYIIQTEQAGLGLQFPEMYEGTNTQPILDAYLKLAKQVATLVHTGGDCDMQLDSFSTQIDESMQKVIDFETALSKLFVPKSELQDPTEVYHKMNLSDFQNRIPLINMTEYMNQMFEENVPLTEKLVVYTPDYFPRLNHLLSETPPKVVANYMTWQLVQPFLTYLSEQFEAVFREFQEVISGTRDMPPLWRRCVARADDAFGFATGAMFVHYIHGGDIKREADEMIENIREAFISNLPNVSWMDDATRAAAEEKAEAVSEHIGYPKWIDDPQQLDKHYEKAEVSDECIFSNFVAMRKFNIKRMLARRGKPTNSSKWELTPAAVNAYYNPSYNQMVFPSGIFQYPFYHSHNLKSMNFGGIGMVMGHELTHGFDNQGRKFDKNGNMNDWWGAESALEYEKKAKCMVNQYSQYQVDGAHIDGQFTLPENIADNGGLKLAYQAFQKWKARNGDELTDLPGIDLNADQLFFLGFAQIWCSYQTPEYARLAVVSDSHTHDMYRVIGVLSNSHEFAEAFSCDPGTPMNPRHKCQVW